MPDSFFASKSRKRKRTDNTKTPRSTNRGGRLATNKTNIVAPKKSKKFKDDIISNDDEDDDDEGQQDWGDIQGLDLRPEEPDPGASEDEEEDTNETPAQKRLRLAQIYLDSVKESLADSEFDAAEIDKQLISSRLKQDVLSHSGKLHLFIADFFSHYSSSSSSSTSPSSQPTPTPPRPPTLRTRGHRFSITSAIASDTAKYLFTAGKEGNIIKWDLLTGKKLAVLHKSKKLHPPTTDAADKSKSTTHGDTAHTDQVLALALSSDGKYLASGGRDRLLLIWDAESFKLLKCFSGPMNHKDVISALSFRSNSHQLFTASYDRTLKIYDLTPSVMGYIETLFGHQHPILSISSLRGDNCVSAGGRDKTARYWKIVEESQLVFRGGGRSKIREILEGGLRADAADDEEEDEEDDEKKKKKKGKMDYVEGSLECIAMIDETTFVTGGDSGSISLWSTLKKKPIFTHGLAHGVTVSSPTTPGVPPVHIPRWITSLASLPYSDLFVSGSYDGQVRLWKLDPKVKSFSPLGSITIPGVINSLQLLQPPKSFFITTPDTPSSSLSWPPKFPPAPNGVASGHKSGSGSTTEGVGPILVIAGTGQEHRLGRWLSSKNSSSTIKEGAGGGSGETREEGGAINAAYVVALLPQSTRTL